MNWKKIDPESLPEVEVWARHREEPRAFFGQIIGGHASPVVKEKNTGLLSYVTHYCEIEPPKDETMEECLKDLGFEEQNIGRWLLEINIEICLQFSNNSNRLKLYEVDTGCRPIVGTFTQPSQLRAIVELIKEGNK